MKRTTIALEEHLLMQLKREALARGTTVQGLVNDLLAGALRPAVRRSEPFDWPVVHGRLQPGVRLEDRDSLFDLMDGR